MGRGASRRAEAAPEAGVFGDRYPETSGPFDDPRVGDYHRGKYRQRPGAPLMPETASRDAQPGTSRRLYKNTISSTSHLPSGDRAEVLSRCQIFQLRRSDGAERTPRRLENRREIK